MVINPMSPESKGSSNGSPECSRPDLALRLSSGEEVSGSFAVEIGTHAKSCPACSVRLSLLQQAERWLAGQATSNREQPKPASPCPSAEELFDFGHGLGARAIPLAVERRVEAHLVECAECRGLVATLASRPPAPLLDRDSAESPNLPSRPRRVVAKTETLRRVGPRRLWLQVAAAAALLIAALYWLGANRASHGQERVEVAGAQISYPAPKLLRGDSSSSMYFPRAALLAASPAGSPGTWHALRFVIAPQAGATLYRIKLFRSPQGAFGRGEPVGQMTSTLAEFDWSDESGPAPSVGNYTWEAWAKIDGLERSLGRLDFQVIEAAEARAAIAKAEALREPERSTAILNWLVEHEFKTDARAYAIGLPPSPARDAFVAAAPGR